MRLFFAPALRGVVLLLLGATSTAVAAEAPLAPFVNEYCGGCHNAVDWAGGLAFDTLSSTDDPAGDAAVWEKAVRKLRGRLMPPPGRPQPTQANIDGMVGWLEGRLDTDAAAHPDPGHVVLRRLNRTEYSRAVEDVLGVKVDSKIVLPRDVSSDGFDTVAASLRISPAFLEQYIAAARAVARQAVARPQVKTSSREYRHPGGEQLTHVQGLPLGTRGGMVVDHYFPADGEYEFSITDFHFAGAGYITKIDAAHRVVLLIDDRRVFENSFGGPEDLKLVDQTFAGGEGALQSRFNHIRVQVKAGQRRVGVAFVERSHAESDSQLQPIAMLPEMERIPGIPGVVVSGPFNSTGVTPTTSRQRLFVCHPATADDELPCAKRILGGVAQRAFRRSVTDDDLRAPLQFFAQGRAGNDFDAGIESGLTAILSSTNFLFQAKSVPEGLSPGGIWKLTDVELASRLSFFLWSSGPDQTLIELAARGRLQDPAELRRQVTRMLADPRSASLVSNFAFQWLNVGRIDNIEPDPLTFPDFDRSLREGLREEIRLFIDSVLRADRSVLDLLQADYSFLNERVARHYGIEGIRGSQFRRVNLADANRHGLLGKGALLMGTSYGNRTSPVLRGAWVLETLSGTPPTAPPLGVEALAEGEAGKRVLTVRERIEAHRAQASCNACHGVIDPLGFALENYDVTGAWRAKDLDAGNVIDARGVLPDGQRVGSPADLRRALLSRPQQFVQTLTEKLMVYALGRSVEHQDMPLVRSITRGSATAGYRFEAIVQAVVASDAFRLQRLPLQVETRQASNAGP
jgi:hypothetical protein